MFLKDFSILALHLKHYGKTNFLEFVIHKKRSENRNVEYKLENEVGQIKITFATNLEGDPAEIVFKKKAKSLSDIHLQYIAHESRKSSKSREESRSRKASRTRETQRSRETEGTGEDWRRG